MADLYAVSGCKIFIGGPLAAKSTDFVVGDYTTQVWVEITGWSMMGAVGDAAQIITESIISEGRDKKVKGTRNAGSMQNQFVTDDLDPGQLAMVAAEKTRNNYAFKVELNDKPTAGASPKNSQRLFIGMVAGVPEQGGSANTIQKVSNTIEINSNIVRVAASAT
jgi:hypothetical protein